MKIRHFIIMLIFIMALVVIDIIFTNYKRTKRPDIKIPILLYHDFVEVVPDNLDDYNYINTKESFEENVKVLLENGYTFMSFKELNDAYNKKIELPKKPILLTFDDGYYSNYKYIYPVLKKYNVKVSIFIVTNNIEKKVKGKKYLSWKDCKTMENSGLVEIFSHSKRHVFHNKLPVRTLLNDVDESYKIIEKHLGKKDLKVFAYPYGAYTKETVFVLKRNGIDMQVYDIGMNNFKDFNKNYIKRINIPCEMTGKEIVEDIENNY